VPGTAAAAFTAAPREVAARCSCAESAASTNLPFLDGAPGKCWVAEDGHAGAQGCALRSLVGPPIFLTSINTAAQAKPTGEQRARVEAHTRPYSPTAGQSGLAARDQIQARRKMSPAVPAPRVSEKSPEASSAGQEGAGSEDDSEEVHDTRESTSTLEEGAGDAGGVVFCVCAVRSTPYAFPLAAA